MRLHPFFALPLVVGCSALINGEEYLADGATDPVDAGDIDGNVVVPDGGDAGPMLDSDVPNRAPIASGVGLSDYRPRHGTTLRALVGPTYDPDGDTVRRTFQWFSDGAAIAGATGVTLDVELTVFPVGTEISFEVSVDDTILDGAMISAGPAIVVDDTTTRWRMLLPPRGGLGQDSIGFFDPIHQRMIYMATDDQNGYTWWERQITDDPAAQWVQIFIGGAAPTFLQGEIAIDRANRRVLYYAGQHETLEDTSGDRLFALDLTAPQGSETWVELSASGTVPSPRFASTLLVVESEGAAFVYGGIDLSLRTAHNDFYRLTLTPGSESWEQLSVPMPTTPLLVPSIVHDPVRNRLVMTGGGAPFAPPVEFPPPEDTIYVLDLTDVASGWVLQPATLSRALVGNESVIHDDVLYVFGGFGTVTNRVVQAYDLDTFALLPRASQVGQGIESLFTNFESRAPFDAGWVIHGGAIDGRMTFRALDVSSDPVVWTPITGETIDLPPPLQQGTTYGLPAFTLVGGQRPPDAAILGPSPGVRGNDATYEHVDGVWNRIELPADGGFGAPMPRWGFSYDSTAIFRSDFTFLLGGVTTAGPADTRVWSIRRGTTHLLSEMMSAPAPPSRVGHAIFRGNCADASGNGQVVGFVGGRIAASGTTSNETWSSTCADSSPGTARDCIWFEATAAGGQAPSVVWPALTIFSEATNPFDRYAMMFGGLSPTGATNAFYTFDTCASASGLSLWRPVAVTMGTAPSPRMGHTFTQGRGPSDPTFAHVAYIFGGADDEDAQNARNDVFVVQHDSSDLNNPSAQSDPLVVDAGGPQPRGRIHHVAFYDTDLGRLLVYGGATRDQNGDLTTLGDLWELRIR